MCYGYHIWSKEALMQAENDDDLDLHQGHHHSQLASALLLTKMQAENDDDLDGGQRSNGVNYVIWLPYLIKRIGDAR